MGDGQTRDNLKVCLQKKEGTHKGRREGTHKGRREGLDRRRVCPVSACVAHFGKNRWIQDRGGGQGWLGERAGWLVGLNSRTRKVEDSRREGVSRCVSSFPLYPFPSPDSIPHPPLLIRLSSPWAAYLVVYARTVVSHPILISCEHWQGWSL